MRFLMVLGLVAVSLGAFASDTPRPDPKQRSQLMPVGPDWVPPGYCGKVMGLTKNGVVIKPERGLKILEITPLPDGTTRERVYVQDNTRPPREFVFSDVLFPNRPGPKSPRCGEHEVADLRVGDIVEISSCRFQGTDYCTALWIRRRPGGKVPPMILDGKSTLAADGINAQQFGEETLAPKWAPWMLLHFGR